MKFPQSTMDKLDLAAELTGLPKQELIRFCTAIGLEDLKKVGFDLAKLVSDTARPELVKPGAVVPFESKVAEEPARRTIDLTDGPRAWVDFKGGLAAGAPIDGDLVEEPIPSLKQWPDDHYALRVFGRSMEPKVRDGALIIVKAWPTDKGTPRKGTLVVYHDGHGASLKEFGYRKAEAGEEGDSFGNVAVLRSINKAFPDVQMLEGGKIEAVLVDVL
ncbi:S24 family peptidase [Luteolibacter arcticus]|uniref:S24 family peptidase n=1 Tax=Luteolibacter arcticus TaxID=1581411 RepID=A0ABT3GGI2_9BACT|nr:S24 family peptidase [Luteolibacter arcticus]MCW1922684.1 S24 family peptidase [Luteolibacter arcticus]